MRAKGGISYVLCRYIARNVDALLRCALLPALALLGTGSGGLCAMVGLHGAIAFCHLSTSIQGKGDVLVKDMRTKN